MPSQRRRTGRNNNHSTGTPSAIASMTRACVFLQTVMHLRLATEFRSSPTSLYVRSAIDIGRAQPAGKADAIFGARADRGNTATFREWIRFQRIVHGPDDSANTVDPNTPTLHIPTTLHDLRRSSTASGRGQYPDRISLTTPIEDSSPTSVFSFVRRCAAL